MRVAGAEFCKRGINASVSEKAVIRQIDDERIRMHPALNIASKERVNRISLSTIAAVIGKHGEGNRW